MDQMVSGAMLLVLICPLLMQLVIVLPFQLAMPPALHHPVMLPLLIHWSISPVLELLATIPQPPANSRNSQPLRFALLTQLTIDAFLPLPDKKTAEPYKKSPFTVKLFTKEFSAKVLISEE